MKIMSYHKKIQYYKWNKKDTKILFHSIQELINIKSLQFYMPFYSLYFYIHNKPQSNLKIDLQRNFYIRKIKEIIKERYYNSNLILLGSIYDSSKNILMHHPNVTAHTARNLKAFERTGDVIEWEVTDTEVKYFSYTPPTWIEPTIGVELTVTIQRNYQYYIYKVISPIILILLVCWSVFWIHPRELESKLTITIVCLLSLIAYNFVIDEDLPKLSHLTIMDYIILLAYIFATIPNFLSIIAFRLQSSGDPADEIKWKRNDKISRVYGPVVFVMLILIIIFINTKGNSHTAAFLSVFR